MLAKLNRWIVFGVIFSLLPFAFAYFEYLKIFPTPQFYWYYLWPKGDLLLVSVGFAADAAGDALAIKDRFPMVKAYLLGICIVVVAISCYFYALAPSYMARYGPKVITGGSLCLFALTFVCSALCKALAEVD